MTEAQRLYKLFLALKPGAILLYHVGHLATDAPKRPDIRAVKDLMMDLRDRRMGRLSQRRLDDGIFEYRIEKASPPPATTKRPQG